MDTVSGVERSSDGSPDPVTAPLTPKEMWNQRYRIDDYVYGTEPNEFLRSSLPLLPTGAALCLADGEGRNGVFLAEAGYEVRTVDLSDAAVEKSRSLAAARGVELDAQVGDLAEYDLGISRWDLIVSIFAHTPPSVRRALHRRVVTALAPGGAFLLEAYTPDQIGRGTGGPPTAALTMTSEELREELSPLEFVHVAELERVIVEGAGHTGVGAVVQVIATRAT